jgi:hypothetical protein
MPCLIVIGLVAPRGCLFFIWLLTEWFAKAFETWYWPLIGFLIMPYTTLAYMGAMLNNGYEVGGWWVVLLIVAVIADLSQGAAGHASGTD